MAKKHEEIIEDVKDVLEDVAETVTDVAKPVVKKVKAAAAQAGTEAVAAVKKATPKKTEYYVQFNGREINMEEIAAKAKASFKENNKRTAVLSCRIYVKPEDSAAYYVINDAFFGRVEL